MSLKHKPIANFKFIETAELESILKINTRLKELYSAGKMIRLSNYAFASQVFGEIVTFHEGVRTIHSIPEFLHGDILELKREILEKKNVIAFTSEFFVDDSLISITHDYAPPKKLEHIDYLMEFSTIQDHYKELPNWFKEGLES